MKVMRFLIFYCNLKLIFKLSNKGNKKRLRAQYKQVLLEEEEREEILIYKLKLIS